MAFQKVEVVKVSYCKKNSLIPVGRLAVKNHVIYFEYEQSFLETGLELSPFKLPLKPGVVASRDTVFDGLFGLFNDSLPDGWGRLLLDRKLAQLGVDPRMLTPLDRLRFVGRHGMGALVYAPSSTPFQERQGEVEDLDRISEECLGVLEHEEEEYVDTLLQLTNSSMGARPKILVRLNAKGRPLQVSNNDPSSPHNDWIIKFRSSLDPKDMGPIEYAYHMMAQKAGVEVPEARLFKSKKWGGYYGVKRFDRGPSSFLHMHTVSGLLHADFRIPSLDYETIMKATMWLTKDVRECEKQFRNSVFNVLAHNRDDHGKNFSFLMHEEGNWVVSPAYDLTFSFGPAGEHATTVMGEGKRPQMSHLLRLAQVGGIKEARAKEIIEQVREAVVCWNECADASGVSASSRAEIHTALGFFCKGAQGL